MTEPDASLGGRDTHTLREHLDAIRGKHEGIQFEHVRKGLIWECDYCDRPWPCFDYEHAVAALAILDTSEFQDVGLHYMVLVRLVPDDDPQPDEAKDEVWMFGVKPHHEKSDGGVS